MRGPTANPATSARKKPTGESPQNGWARQISPGGTGLHCVRTVYAAGRTNAEYAIVAIALTRLRITAAVGRRIGTVGRPPGTLIGRAPSTDPDLSDSDARGPLPKHGWSFPSPPGRCPPGSTRACDRPRRPASADGPPGP
jgi:hypothetical protein